MKEKELKNRSRLVVEGRSACYHVVSRTVRDFNLFADGDKEMLVRMIWKQAGFCGLEVLTYAVMSNHFHVLLRVPCEGKLTDAELLKRYKSLYGGKYAPESSLAPEEFEQILNKGGSEADKAREEMISRMGDLRIFMQELKQRFVRWYNNKHENYGTIWSQRYKSVLIEDSPGTLPVLAAYIDLNSVRAEIVKDPREYRYCGYAESMRGGNDARDCISRIWKNEDSKNGLKLYQMMLMGNDEDGKSRIESKEGGLSISEALRSRVRYFSDGMVIGQKTFVDEIFHEDRSRFGPKRKTGARRMRGSAWSELYSMRDLKD